MTKTQVQKLESERLLDLADEVLAPSYHRPGKLFTRGQGCRLCDSEGREYLDFTSGIAVQALGHASEVVVQAIRDHANDLIHVSNLFHTEAPIRLAERLVELSFADAVFFTNSGAEAVEAAIKFARLFHGDRGHEVLFASGSFHGRTLGALAATDRPDFQAPFGPMPEGFVKIPWNSEEALDAVTEKTALVMIEPIQGERGIREANPEWVRRLRHRCDQTGSLLGFDEVQCGLGRTGTLWAHEVFGVEPDIMVLAKPLAGGLPMGAVLMTRPVADCLYPGAHGTTFGGGPFISTVALKVLDHIATPGFLHDIQKKSLHLDQLLLGLRRSPWVTEIRGRGLMRGIQITHALPDAVEACRAHGLLVAGSGDQVLRLLPPLTITEGELDLGIERMESALTALEETHHED